jgi:hypothetical protein
MSFILCERLTCIRNKYHKCNGFPSIDIRGRCTTYILKSGKEAEV